MPLTYRNNKYYTPAEFAAQYSVTPQTVYLWMKNGITKDGAALEIIKLMDKQFIRVN